MLSYPTNPLFLPQQSFEYRQRLDVALPGKNFGKEDSALRDEGQGFAGDGPLARGEFGKGTVGIGPAEDGSGGVQMQDADTLEKVGNLKQMFLVEGQGVAYVETDGKPAGPDEGKKFGQVNSINIFQKQVGTSAAVRLPGSGQGSKAFGCMRAKGRMEHGGNIFARSEGARERENDVNGLAGKVPGQIHGQVQVAA